MGISEIRKISVGPDYKSGAMHYILGQQILGGSHTIHHMREKPAESSFEIFIENINGEVFFWKKFVGVPVSIEYNINF